MDTIPTWQLIKSVYHEWIDPILRRKAAPYIAIALCIMVILCHV